MRNHFDDVEGQNSNIGSFMNAIEERHKTGLFGASVGASVAALESYDQPDLASAIGKQLRSNANAISSLIHDGEYRVALENYLGRPSQREGHAPSGMSTIATDWVHQHQVECAVRLGAMALEAAQNPIEYFTNVNNAVAKANESAVTANYVADYTNGGSAFAQGISPTYALEAFENNNLATALSMSVTYNLASAVQDPAIELLFKTIVMSPEEVTVFYEIAVDRFWNGYMHDAKSKAQRNFHKHMTMDAIRDPSILHQDVLNIVPFFQEKGEGKNDDAFMPKTTMTPTERLVAGVPILTNPLKVGLEHDLLKLSQHPGLANGGVFDETDTLDSMLAIDKLYLNVGDDDADGVIELPLAGLERRNFLKAIQGHGMDMELNFISTEFVLNEETLSTQGTLPDKIKAFTDLGYNVRVEISARGIANVETGYMRIQHTEARVVSARKVTKGKDGQRDIWEDVDIVKTTELKQKLDALKLQVKYFTPDTNRTNANIRTLGILLDRDVFTAKYAIGIRSPVRYQRKVGTKESPAEILEALVRFARLRQTADGWYELFRYRDTLKAYQTDSMRDDKRIPDFIGVGKYMIKPFYRHLEIDLLENVKSLDSKNTLDNIREYIVAVMQETAAEGLVASNWLIAAAQQNNGNAVDPHFGIVCGQYVPLVLSLRGDLRLMGENFGHTIKTTQNKIMDERIFMTLVNPEAKGIDGLAFGNTFTYPEVVVSISPHSVNGAVRETFIVQQRYQHIPHLPFLIEISLKNLKEVIHNYNLVQVKFSEDNSPLAKKPGAVALPGVGGAGVPGGVPGG